MSSENRTIKWKADKPIGLCCDHAGFELKETILKWLRNNAIEFVDFGTYTNESCDYADFAHRLAVGVEEEKCYPGISICGSGNGINMTMNKHQKIRSAICWAEELARLTRAHNDANVLTLPARFINEEEAYKILIAFLETEFDGGRHQTRIDKIPL